jgi:hypothetical protein
MTKQIDALMALADAYAAAQNYHAQEAAYDELRAALEAALSQSQQVASSLKPGEPIGYRYKYLNFMGDEVWAFDPPRNGKVLETVPVYTSAPPAQPDAPRPVTPYQCPKCHALWLHWPKEQSGFDHDSLSVRSSNHCAYCEAAGVDQLERLERVPAKLVAPSQECDHGPVAETISEAARDVGKWLNERPNRPIDLRHVAMLVFHVQTPPPRLTDDEVLQFYTLLNSENHPELDSPSVLFTWIYRAIESAVRRQFLGRDE